ncbi:DUF7144 family membrane protein [Allosalinactinospora lopnorensis]|uniref:DUF7144 family membrane protein n=1 Tax=Allosalinactinospora lopnorensis TaxID=1352348 RepID=UPI000697547F|nr:hypothetical protein [Allosalinactinospora lopnorensis]
MNNVQLHGWGAFAATVVLLAGAFHLIQGITAMAAPAFFVGTEGQLLIAATFVGWGIVLAILGLVLILTGIALFYGYMWARVLGVVLAGIGAVLQLGFLAAFPIWSLAVIVLNVVVIYGLTAGWSTETRDEEVARAAASYQAGRTDATRATAPTQRESGAHERPDMPSGGTTTGGP